MIVWPLRSTTTGEPVNVAQSASLIVAAGEIDDGDVVLRDLAIRSVHAHRVADAAEIDELSAHLLAGAQRQRCAVLRVGDARDEHGRRANRAENRPLQHAVASICIQSPEFMGRLAKRRGQIR